MDPNNNNNIRKAISTGFSVPSVSTLQVKAEPNLIEQETEYVTSAKNNLVKDIMCPICFQTMKEAFSTSCGHSFCYACITTHLNNKNNCPCCGAYLTTTQVFPNFLLNKLLKKASSCQLVNSVSPLEQFKLYLQEGSEVSLKELDALLTLISEKKRKSEQEEAATNMEVLLYFLHRVQQQKQEELKELEAHLRIIKEDVAAVQLKREELHRSKDRYALKFRMFLHASQHNFASGAMPTPGSSNGGPTPEKNQEVAMILDSSRKEEFRSLQSSLRGQKRTLVFDGLLSRPQGLVSSNSSSLTTQKKRILSQFDELQECYLLKRQSQETQIRNCQGLLSTSNRNFESEGLEQFQHVLRTFTRYSRLRVVAEVRQGDLFHSSNIISSIEFDRDDALFATAGVSRCIKVFELASIVNSPTEVHFPIVEMATRSKLICLSWNKHYKNLIASSDNEGVVAVWDVNRQQSIMEHEEHEKRVWSVDFCATDPSRLASGGDDCKVRIWCTKDESVVSEIDMKAYICCVKYNPSSSNYLAVASANRQIHYYDLRNARSPLYAFSGHRKTVSYVKFLSSTELVSASTDSTVRLWDVQENRHVRTLTGHRNEKNFVGLSVSNDSIACGSETNEVCIYNKEISNPIIRDKFELSEDGNDDTSSYVSAVCWKGDGQTLLAANSLGTIKVLVLA